MRKSILEKRLQRLTERRDALKARGLASTDAAEVRSIHAQLAEMEEDMNDIREEISALEEEETRSAAPVQNQQIVGAFAAAPAAETRSENPLESRAYREAFMAYVQRGVSMPAEYSAASMAAASQVRTGAAAVDSTDVGPAVPITVMREVINTVRKRYGNLYAKVRKLNVQGGVQFPVGELQATFKWITEKTVSPDQQAGTLGKVSFGYHVAEIRVAQTFLASIITLEDFEAAIEEIIAVAYLQAMDKGIVAGTGDGQMLGILNDARVTNVVQMNATDLSSWTAWRKNFFSKLPLGYRAGEFIFPLSTVESYLETMQDSNGNPIFRQATGIEVNDGDAQDPNGRFFGRAISLVEPDILPDFDDASNGDVIGIYWQPQEYAINENFGFTMRRYFDEETNKWINKALVVVDGKVLNPTGYVLIKKKA